MMEAMPEHDFLFKFLLIGDSGVGKSKLLLRFADGVYSDESVPTIGVDFKICRRTVEGKVVKMTLWDTAGQERFRTITSSYYRGSHGVIVVYDITDRQSFQHARGWMQEIEKYAKNAGTVRMLVGNKSDLGAKRVVSEDEGRELAEELGVAFLETSARAAQNVEEAFDLLVVQAKRQAEPEGGAQSTVHGGGAHEGHAGGEARAESAAHESVEGEGSSRQAGDGAAPEGGGHVDQSTMATLRFNMYIAWLAILLVGALIIGRRFCRSGRGKRSRGHSSV